MRGSEAPSARKGAARMAATSSVAIAPPVVAQQNSRAGKRKVHCVESPVAAPAPVPAPNALLFNPDDPMSSDSEVEVVEEPTQVDVSFGDGNDSIASASAAGDEGEEEDDDFDEDEPEDLTRELPKVWNHKQELMWDNEQLYGDEIGEFFRVLNPQTATTQNMEKKRRSLITKNLLRVCFLYSLVPGSRHSGSFNILPQGVCQ